MRESPVYCEFLANPYMLSLLILVQVPPFDRGAMWPLVFFWCVTPYCIVFCSVCPLTVNLLLQEPATVHRCVHVDRVLYLHAGQRVLLHSAHQRRVSVLLGSRCGKKLSTMGVVYKTKGCNIRKPQAVVKNKGLW